jgi:hypothetical protein
VPDQEDIRVAAAAKDAAVGLLEVRAIAREGNQSRTQLIAREKIRKKKAELHGRGGTRGEEGVIAGEKGKFKLRETPDEDRMARIIWETKGSTGSTEKLIASQVEAVVDGSPRPVAANPGLEPQHFANVVTDNLWTKMKAKYGFHVKNL